MDSAIRSTVDDSPSGVRSRHEDGASSNYTAHRSFDSPHDEEHSRRGAGMTTTSSSRSSPQIAVSVSSTSPASTSTSSGLPRFFVTVADIAAVHLSPDPSSGVVRTLLAGTVVFVTESSRTIRRSRSPDSGSKASSSSEPDDGIVGTTFPMAGYVWNPTVRVGRSFCHLLVIVTAVHLLLKMALQSLSTMHK